MRPPSPPSGAVSADGSALIGRVVGPYCIESRLGGGGMGVVYRATDTRLGRPVALKFLSPALHADDRARQRLLQEARTVAALDHPHVASVYDVGETDDGRLYIAMALYEGETLEARIARGPLAPEAAVMLARQMATGLGAAHRAGIVHRDVKPANVIIVEDHGEPSVKVLDFGIAKQDDVALTQPGESIGTALYMSPEQLRGEPVDARSDVWALGAVLYEMLAGRRPFEGSYAAAVGYAVLHEAPAPLAREDLPDGLEAVVLRCLEKSPEARFASMGDLASALGSSTQTSGDSGLRAPVAQDRAPVVAPEAGRSGLWRWAAALLVAVLGAAAAVALWPETAVAEAQRLVVLPFRASGADAEPLAAGLVEAVTNKLSQLDPGRERIRVVPASEVTADMTPTEAHERFGATLVVEGTVATEGDAVRLTLGLVEVGEEGAAQGETIQIDDASGSAFALQDAAALGVAELLRVEVGAETRDALAAGGTDDPEANARYLRGRGVLRSQQSVEDLERARGLFADALALDDAFALAYAGMAEAEWQLYRRTDEVEWADRALASGQRALDLDDRLPEVHVAMAIVHQGRGDYAQALDALDRALELDPTNSEAFRRQAKVYSDMDRAPEAEAAFRRAIALAPDFWRTHNSLGVFYLGQGRADAAADQFRQGLELDPINLSLLLNLGVAAWQEGDVAASNTALSEVLRLDSTHAGAARNLISARLYLGDFPGAVRVAEHAVALQPNDYDARAGYAEALWWDDQRDRATAEYGASIRAARQHLAIGRDPFVLMTMAHAFAATGQTDSARVYLAELERELSPTSADVQDAYAVGLAYEVAGNRALALRWFQSAVDRGFGAAQIQSSPRLADLRADPLASGLVP